MANAAYEQGFPAWSKAKNYQYGIQYLRFGVSECLLLFKAVNYTNKSYITMATAV
jgi:hypothetical protein